jgi:Glycosyl transferase family 2
VSRVLAPALPAPPAPLTEPPTFSVVIPAYQAAATIRGAVGSVLAQTLPALEIIVCDDGSTDELELALKPFAASVRLIRRPHGGVAAARNAGLRACRGDFVLIVDADDFLLERKLEALSRLGQARPDLDLLSTDVYFEVDGQRAGCFNEANPFSIDDQRTAILERCFVGWPAARRSRLLAVGGFDESLSTAEDWDCWIRLVLDGALAGMHDEPLSVYRISPGSLTASRSATLRDRLRIIEKARAHPGLRPDERSAVERALAVHRARAVLAEAQEAVAQGRQDARRRCLEAAGTRQIALGSRLRAMAAAVAPARTRGWLLRATIAGSLISRAVPTPPDRHCPEA